MFDRRQEVLEQYRDVPKKPKGPRDTVMTSVSDFIHFISMPGGMTIKEAEAKFGVKECTVLRWKRKAIEVGVEIEVQKRDGTPVYTCDPFESKLTLAEAIGQD